MDTILNLGNRREVFWDDYIIDAKRTDAEKKLRFTPGVDFDAWKKEVREKFITLLGLDRIAKNACEPNVEIEEEVQMDGYRRIRFTFESEKGAIVPCYLLVPDDAGEKKYPVAIAMQGHSSGFHNSRVTSSNFLTLLSSSFVSERGTQPT